MFFQCMRWGDEPSKNIPHSPTAFISTSFPHWASALSCTIRSCFGKLTASHHSICPDSIQPRIPRERGCEPSGHAQLGQNSPWLRDSQTLLTTPGPAQRPPQGQRAAPWNRTCTVLTNSQRQLKKFENVKVSHRDMTGSAAMESDKHRFQGQILFRGKKL